MYMMTPKNWIKCVHYVVGTECCFTVFKREPSSSDEINLFGRKVLCNGIMVCSDTRKSVFIDNYSSGRFKLCLMLRDTFLITFISAFIFRFLDFISDSVWHHANATLFKGASISVGSVGR